MLTSEKIRSIAPFGSSIYRLLAKLSDGSSKMFPAESGAFFRIGDPPAGAPPGKYSICFYDSHNQLVKCAEDALDIAQPEAALPTQLQLNLSAPGAAVAPSAALAATQPKPAARPVGSDPVEETDLEYRRHLHAMDLEERQQEFIKSSTYVTELGEVFTLNRLMRREMLEMHHIIVKHSQRAYQDIEQVKGTVHELLDLQKAVLDHAAQHIARPPAPPPDFVGLGHSALSVIKEIGVALIQRHHAKEGSLPAKSAPAQLPAAADKPPAAEMEAKPAAAPDAITQMVEKLKGISDGELAVAMSSPDGWRSLLDALRTQEKPATPAKEATP